MTCGKCSSSASHLPSWTTCRAEWRCPVSRWRCGGGQSRIACLGRTAAWRGHPAWRPLPKSRRYVVFRGRARVTDAGVVCPAAEPARPPTSVFPRRHHVGSGARPGVSTWCPRKTRSNTTAPSSGAFVGVRRSAWRRGCPGTHRAAEAFRAWCGVAVLTTIGGPSASNRGPASACRRNQAPFGSLAPSNGRSRVGAVTSSCISWKATRRALRTR